MFNLWGKKNGKSCAGWERLKGALCDFGEEIKTMKCPWTSCSQRKTLSEARTMTGSAKYRWIKSSTKLCRSLRSVCLFSQSWKQTRRTRFSSNIKCLPDKHRKPRDTDRQREKRTSMLFYMHYPLPLKTIQARIQSGLISLLPWSLHWANPPLSDQARPSSPSAFLKHSNHHSSHHLSILYICQPYPLLLNHYILHLFPPHGTSYLLSPLRLKHPGPEHLCF